MKRFLSPATVIEVDCGLYKHAALVTDVFGADGFPTVIHNSMCFGGVQETTWAECVQNRTYTIAWSADTLTAPFVLIRARSAIGSRYNLLTFNCDHFIRWVFGLRPESPQLKAWAALGLFACTAAILSNG